MTNIDEVEFANSVILQGILAAEPVTRTLPSGDQIVSFRVNVRRPAGTVRAGRVGVDSIDSAAGTAAVRRILDRVRPGDCVHVGGRLQRRFWRAPAGVASRYEVEVSTLKRITLAKRRRADRESVG
jgi:single-strand DNA-binding protein